MILCRWDLFPGITASDLPAGDLSQSLREGKGGDQISSLPQFQQKFAPAKLHRISKNPANGSKKGFNDLLARTFDVPDMESSE